MVGTVLQLHGSSVAAIATGDDGEVSVRFAPAMIVKSEGIPRVDASTLWTQSGELVIGEGQLEGTLPALPALLSDGSMEAAGLKYIGVIPIPLGSLGHAELKLTFEDGAELTVTGADAKLGMEDTPRYVKHIAETQPPG